MNLRICLLTTVSVFCFGALHAQDKIYKRNGEVVEGKVKEVGTNTISYKKSSNPDGPDYTIDKDDIDHITYQNGEGENFNNNNQGNWPPLPPGFPAPPGSGKRGRHNAPPEQYGNNIVSLSPLQVTDNGVGLALSYERVIDKKGIVSFYFPIAVAFNNDNSGSYYGDNGDYQTWYFMPGIKFYPTGSKGVIKYSVGPSLAFVTGKENAYVYQSQYPPYYSYYETRNFFLFGMVVNNTLNIQPTPHLHMALELGLGFSYTGSEYYNEPIGLAQFGFQIGYRF